MQIFENRNLTAWFEDGIVFGMYKKGCIISLQAAKEIVQKRLVKPKTKDHLHLIYISHIGVITPEAKAFFAKEAHKGIKKLAIVTTNPFKVVLGNLWIRNDKPVKPTGLFGKEEAVRWLKSQEWCL